jgi:hypothetical protein
MMSPNAGLLQHNDPDLLSLGGFCKMRRDELMKPDMLSEVLLLIMGGAIFMVLVSTLWLAVFNTPH